MTKKLLRLLLALTALTVFACATTQNMPVPKTTSEKIAYAEATLTGLVNAAATLTETNIIDLDTAQKINDAAREADNLLTTARKLLKDGNEVKASDVLMEAEKALVRLNELISKYERRK